MKRSVYSEKPLVKSNGIRDILLNQRSLLIFHSAIHSKYTKESYDKLLNQFTKYYIIKDFDSLLSIEPKKLQTMIEDYVMYLRSEDKSYSTINSTICSLNLFFSMNDITLNWKKLKKLLPEKKKTIGDKPYTTDQVKEILNHTSNLKFRAVIHFMASSGVRVGSFVEMKIKDLEDFKDGCKSVKVYAGSKDEYYTFIHQEAVKSLEEYFEYRRKKGEKLTPDSWVFISTSPEKPMCTETITSSLSRFVTRSLVRKKTGLRYDTMTCHALRKRFATVLKSNKEINLSIAEKLLGHSTTIQLDNVYFKPTLEVMFDEYQKAIPNLVIDESERLKLELEKKNNQLSSLEVKDRRIEQLENALSRIELNMNELKSRF